MDLVDLLIIAILLLSGIVGMSIGLLGAAITAVGALSGWVLAGRFGGELAVPFTGLVPDFWAVLIAYAIIMVLSLAAAGVVKSLVLPALSIATFRLSSLVDRVGGLLMGLVIGIIVVGAIVSGLDITNVPL